MKTFNEFILECYELEESSTGERSGRRTRGKLTLARGRGADMTRQERSTASIAKKAGLKGTGKYSTKDLRSKTKEYSTDDSYGVGTKGSTKQDTIITTHSSPRQAAEREGIINKSKSRFTSSGYKTEIKPSSDSVRRVKDLRKQITKAGASKRGQVHSVDILPRDMSVSKGDKKKQIERGKNFIQALKDTPEHLKKAGAKKGESVIGKPTAVMPDEDKKTGEEKRAKLYRKIFKGKSTKKSNTTGYVSGKVDESYELEESSTGERSGRRTRGRLTLARGRGADMERQERTTAAIAKKAGLKGTGKYSTKDLRTKAKDYTTYDSEDTDDDYGSTEQDHYIRTYSSARKAAKGEHLIKKYKPAGKTPTGMTKLKTAPSKESVRRVKDLKKQISKAGAKKRGPVHNVDIMHRDSDVGKGDPDRQMERGRNFIQALKDTPKHLKRAGAKKGEAVVGKPTAVMSGEDQKTGVAKRAKLYKKVFGKRSSDKSNKTGLMTGKVD